MKEDKLKKLIQSVDLDKPKADFTESVMKEIQLEESLLINTDLQSVLTHHIIETPSIDFTQKVMMGIERLDKKVVYEPIISKKVWYGIGIAASVIIALAGMFGQSAQTTNQPPRLTNHIYQITGQMIAQIIGMSALALACLFALSVLLVFDYFFAIKKEYQSDN